MPAGAPRYMFRLYCPPTTNKVSEIWPKLKANYYKLSCTPMLMEWFIIMFLANLYWYCILTLSTLMPACIKGLCSKRSNVEATYSYPPPMLIPVPSLRSVLASFKKLILTDAGIRTKNQLNNAMCGCMFPEKFILYILRR